MITLMILVDLIVQFLKLDSNYEVFAFLYGMIFLHLLTFYQGFLNGLGYHAMSNLLGLSLSIIRALSTWGLLISGMGYALYTIAALSFSHALTSILGGWLIYLLIQKLPKKETSNSKPFNNRQELNFLYPSFVTWTSVAILTNIDIIVVKHHFDEVITGHFTQETIIARIGLFITSALTMVLLPEITIAGNKQPKNLVRTALLVSVGIAGIFSLFCWTIPDLLLHLFFSSNASESVYLPMLSVIYVLVAILNLIFIINLGRGNYLVQYIYFFAILLFSITVFLINIENINQFIYLMTLFLLFLLLIDLFTTISKSIINTKFFYKK